MSDPNKLADLAVRQGELLAEGLEREKALREERDLLRAEIDACKAVSVDYLLKIDQYDRLRKVAEARLKISDERIEKTKYLFRRYEEEIESLRNRVVALRNERDKLLKLPKGRK